MPTFTAENFADPVTAHMQAEFARLRADDTVGQALETIRTTKLPGRIVYFYALDEAGRLQGVVPTRRLLMSTVDTPIRDIMVKNLVTIPPQATVLDACEFFTQYRLLAFPVTEPDRKMLGVIDVELYTDELRDIGIGKHDDLFQLIGVHLSSARKTSPWAAFGARFPWLLTNIGGGLVAAWISWLFEGVLAQTVALALFIPVVLALSESVAMQSVSLTLQWLHGNRPTWSGIFVRCGIEARTGLLLGAASAAIVGLVAGSWLGNLGLVTCLLVTIPASVVVAAVLGMLVPTVLRLLNSDPHLASGPIALAIADMATLVTYFSLANWWLG
jgi:magnesium transporter